MIETLESAVNRKSTRQERWIFYSIIVISVLSSSVILPRLAGIVLLVGTYAVFILITFSRRGYFLIGPHYAFFALALLSSLMVLNHVMGKVGDITHVLFPAVTVFLLVANLFVIPHVINSEYFAFITSRVSAVVVIVGLLMLVFGDISLLWFELQNWPGTDQVYYFGELHPLRSIYRGSQNNTAVLLFVGFLASIYQLVQEKTSVYIALSVINGVGLYLTHSRGGIGVALIGFSLIFLYLVYRYEAVGVVTISGGVLFLAGILTYSSIFPGPSWFDVVNLNDRQEIWRAGYKAFKQKPALGYGVKETADIIELYLPENKRGHSIHNAYFRIFLYTGFIGGITYMAFIFYSLIDTVFDDRINIFIFALAVAFAVHHFQGGAPLFGANFKSVSIGLTFGYLINGRYDFSEG
ncbi:MULTISPECIES: O-antigen ligase family protein [Halomicrobium]|uniref:O-antigen polymerase n=2 Tax=Halomicrobium mukohataei TaxID=57705 RepID=C7P3B7_HALMD|nr:MULTISPECIES: O-antigen ligase family protein [Halomicrobium]ACV47589.1 O-antigen polymerase [Halomicrobium mukohataei DSM 12286]QCD66052.1 O-antigen ligase family protein [Halomicrobium mukohataei]QFR20857.1 hypothetical protein GBQ70_10515 [Halomicrobium sp. ZPS1]